jgi:hypothetical protein
MTDKALNGAVKAIQDSLLPDLEAKTFNSGKEGFFAQAKLTIEGTRYQAQVMLVEIVAK